jgi:hypothetical protein
LERVVPESLFYSVRMQRLKRPRKDDQLQNDGQIAMAPNLNLEKMTKEKYSK